MHETAENAALTMDQVKAELEESGIDAAGDEFSVDVAKVVDAYNFAQSQGSAAAMRYAGDVLLHSGLTADMLVQGGNDLAGGFEEFQELFADAAGDTKDMLKNFMTGGGKPGGGKFEAPQVPRRRGRAFSVQELVMKICKIVAIMRKRRIVPLRKLAASRGLVPPSAGSEFPDRASFALVASRAGAHR